MRGTAREEPSAQCSKQETQELHSNHHLLPLPRPQNKDGNRIFKPAMCGNPSGKTSYEICARKRAIYSRAYEVVAT